MTADITTVWDNEAAQQLAEVLSAINDSSMMQNFLRDVMTEKEIIEISARFKAADMLSRGEKYADVIAATRLSSRTIARISDWMKNGTGGYKAALASLHHAHIPPARAE